MSSSIFDPPAFQILLASAPGTALILGAVAGLLFAMFRRMRQP